MQKMLSKFLVVSVALATLSAADAQAKGEDAIVTNPPTAAEARPTSSNIENAGFFSRGTVTDFTKSMNETDRKDYEYYLPEQKKLSLTDDESFEAASTKAQDTATKIELPTAPKTPQDIVAMYGDPNADATVKAVDNAPAPYKGLLAAIEQGRDDLALQYARQWVMYNKKLDKVTKLAVGMAGVVQEKEGMVAPGSFPSTARSQISPEALKAYDENLNSMSANKNIDINDKAKNILDQVSLALNEDGQGSLPPSTPPPTAKQLMDIKRTRFASHLAETYLYVPQGQLDVLVFFRPQDSIAQTIGADFEKLYQKTSGYKNLQFKAFAPDSVTIRDAEVFKKASGGTFPLVQGETLAAELNVKTFPTIVFVSRQTGEAVVEKEFLEYEFVEQMLRKFGVMG